MHTDITPPLPAPADAPSAPGNAQAVRWRIFTQKTGLNEKCSTVLSAKGKKVPLIFDLNQKPAWMGAKNYPQEKPDFMPVSRNCVKQITF